MNFTSIFLKFANTHQTSLFEIEIVNVKDEDIIERKTIRHKPNPDYFDFRNKYIYNITDEEDFLKNVSQHSDVININNSNEIIIGNYPNNFNLFNSSVLNLRNPVTATFSLREIAKKLFPDLLNYEINTLYEFLFKNENNSINHAEKTALIGIEILKRHGSFSFKSLIKQPSSTLLLNFDQNTSDNIFKNKQVSFLENMETLSRKNAQRIATLAGGIVKPGNLSTKTNFLVLGQKKYSDYIKNLPPKIKNLKEKNKSLEIISEKTFLEITIFKPLPNEVTVEQIRKDSKEFLKRNKYNELSGKKVYFSEHLSIKKLHAFQLVGNCSGFGHDYDQDSIPFTDFFIISSNVIELLKSGKKTKSILAYEKQVSKATEKAGTQKKSDSLELSKRIFLIDEESFLEYMKRRELFQQKKFKMNLYEWEI